MMAGPKSEASKLEEQATGKAELSYSYWAANEIKGAPPPEVKKLTDEEKEAHAQEMKRSTSAGASVWNAAGTFEERDLTSWVKGAVEELLVGAEGQPAGSVVAQVTEVVSYSGEVCQWVVRGTTRANFDLDIKLKWTAVVEGEEITGTVRVPNASWDELYELFLEIEVDAADGQDSGREAAKALLPTLRAKLEELVEKIRTYGL